MRLLWWWRFLNGFDRPSVSIESKNTVVVAVVWYYYCTVLHIFMFMFYFCFSFNIILLFVVFRAYACSVPKVLIQSQCVIRDTFLFFIRRVSYISLDAFFSILIGCYFCLWCVCMEFCALRHKWEKEKTKKVKEKNKQVIVQKCNNIYLVVLRMLRPIACCQFFFEKNNHLWKAFDAHTSQIWRSFVTHFPRHADY